MVLGGDVLGILGLVWRVCVGCPEEGRLSKGVKKTWSSER